MGFRFNTEADSDITRILRNEHVYIFYNRSNIYSLISCFFIYKYFEQAQQLEKIHLIQINKPGDIYINIYKFNKELENGNLIFLDCDIRKDIISFYIGFVKRIIIIDDYESSYKVTLNALVESLYSKESKRKVTFTHTPGYCSPCSVWHLLTKDEPVAELLKLQDLYRFKKNNLGLSDYDLVVPSMVGRTFDEIEKFLFKSLNDLTVFKKCFSVVNYVLQNLYNNCLKNSFPLKIKDLKAICINLSENDDRALNYLSQVNSVKLDCDLVITFTQQDNLYKYIITTNNNKLDLLKVFEKLKPIGDSNKIHFYSKKQIMELFK